MHIELDEVQMDELKKAILEKTFEADGKIKLRCADAFMIAGKMDVKIGAIGEICLKEDIRICKCQLKCF